jgi:hypothetical protein
MNTKARTIGAGLNTHKKKLLFFCVKIAKQYDYEIFYIIYHYKLQPIKGIWAVVNMKLQN